MIELEPDNPLHLPKGDKERKAMKIFKIYRKDEVGFDEYDGFAVISCCKKHAKELVSMHFKEGQFWEIECIGDSHYNTQEVVLESYIRP